FETARSYGVGSAPLSVIVTDINADGFLDLTVANRLSGTVSVLLGKGDGTFYGAQNYAAGSRPYAVAAADFNGDGFPDLVVANYSGTVTVLINAANWPP